MMDPIPSTTSRPVSTGSLLSYSLLKLNPFTLRVIFVVLSTLSLLSEVSHSFSDVMFHTNHTAI